MRSKVLRVIDIVFKPEANVGPFLRRVHSAASSIIERFTSWSPMHSFATGSEAVRSFGSCDNRCRSAGNGRSTDRQTNDSACARSLTHSLACLRACGRGQPTAARQRLTATTARTECISRRRAGGQPPSALGKNWLSCHFSDVRLNCRSVANRLRKTFVYEFARSCRVYLLVS